MHVLISFGFFLDCFWGSGVHEWVSTGDCGRDSRGALWSCWVCGGAARVAWCVCVCMREIEREREREEEREGERGRGRERERENDRERESARAREWERETVRET
jgi:hypothetical protein